jgi:integrase
MRICYSGIRFFYLHVLERDWKILDLIRAQAEYRLPSILSVQEVRRLLSMATPLHNRVYFTTVYSLGLRLHEGLFLQVSDIDGQRLMVHVHRGKGAKDRYVPLPPDTLALLRHYWTTHRHSTWLFPATGRDQKHRTTATEPMNRSSVQGAFRKAQQRAGIIKREVGIHTLRHYAEYRIMSSSLRKQGPLLVCSRLILGIIRGRCTMRKRLAGEDKRIQTPAKRRSAMSTLSQASWRGEAEDFTIMPSIHEAIYNVSDGKK